MIGKIHKNNSFKATSTYVLNKAGARSIGGNMSGTEVTELTAEFLMSTDLKPGIKRPVYHVSLSLDPAESNAIDDETFAEIAKQYLTEMGFSDEHQYFAARHTDTDHDHIHIVASRINLSDGTLVSDSNDRYRSQKAIRDLEQAYNLTPVANSWEISKRAETIGQRKKELETQNPSVQRQLQDTLDRVLQIPNIKTLSEFVEELVIQGVSPRVKYTRTGKVQGISYELNDVAMPGYRLGKRYSLPGLQKQIEYRPDRDDIRIQRAQTPQGITQIRNQTLLATQIGRRVLKLWQIANQPEQYRGHRYWFEVRDNTLTVHRRNNESILSIRNLDQIPEYRGYGLNKLDKRYLGVDRKTQRKKEEQR